MEYNINLLELEYYSRNFREYVNVEIKGLETYFNSCELSRCSNEIIIKLNNELKNYLNMLHNSGVGISENWLNFYGDLMNTETNLSNFSCAGITTPVDFKGVDGIGEISKIFDEQLQNILEARKTGSKELIYKLDSEYKDFRAVKQVKKPVIPNTATSNNNSGNYTGGSGERVYGGNNPFVGITAGGYNLEGWHNCTWSAWQLVYEATGIALPVSGNAESWYNEAAAKGWPVGPDPRPNSVAVFAGHVSYVTDVNYDSGSIYVKEGGYLNGYHEGWQSRWATPYGKKIIGYIYLD